MANVLSTDIGLCAGAVGDNTAIAELRKHALDRWIVNTNNRHPVKWYVVNKIHERLVETLDTAIVIQVLRVYIGHDANGCWQP